MQKRLLFTSFLALSMSAGLVVACSDDDDDVRPTPTPDAGPAPDTGTRLPLTDSGPIAVDASPDATTGGPVIVPLTSAKIANAINPYGLVYGSDGLLYVSGATQDLTTGAQQLAAWRYINGVLDTTFGVGGIVTVDLPGSESSLDIVEVSPNNFVVHANAGGKVFLVKLNNAGGAFAFGTPVFVKLGFDENEAWPVGTVTTGSTATPTYAAGGIGIDRSHAGAPKIVVFASGAPAKAASGGAQRVLADRWITRVDATTLVIDPGFNGGVPYTTDSEGKNLTDTARRGLVLADGSIVSAGYTNFGAGLGNHVVLVRLLANGTVDPAFGFGTTPPVPGQTKFNPFLGSGGNAEAYNVARQSSGRYVTAGYGTSNFDAPTRSTDLVSFGVKADGLDTTFGRQGSFAWQSEQDPGAGVGANAYSERARDFTLLPDDRIVFGGSYDDSAALFVLTKDGAKEPNSGVNGLIRYAFASQFYKVTHSADGKRVAATAQSTTSTVDGGPVLGSILVTLKVGE